jgi:hypoxanthine-DNA glycosylase
MGKGANFLPVKITSFPPIVSENATVLVLGSMPGKTSLQRQQYYAHGRNVFWYIMERICGACERSSYTEKVQQLREAGIALWDVLQHCEREGSLDSKIDRTTEVANDFETLLNAYPRIRCIFFNGQKAATAFQRHVWPGLPADIRERVALATLPSTSPAHAALSKEDKLARWRRHIVVCLGEV